MRTEVPERLPVEMAEELTKIHALAPERLPFLEETSVERLVDELDEIGEPHPAIELGLWWLRENRPPPREPVVVHGDFRIGVRASRRSRARLVLRPRPRLALRQ